MKLTFSSISSPAEIIEPREPKLVITNCSAFSPVILIFEILIFLEPTFCSDIVFSFDSPLCTWSKDRLSFGNVAKIPVDISKRSDFIAPNKTSSSLLIPSPNLV